MTDAPDPPRPELPPPDPGESDGLADRARAAADDLTPRQRRQLRRLAALVSLALLVFLFTAETRLIWVMILCLAAGGVAGYLMAGILRRRRDTR